VCATIVALSVIDGIQLRPLFGASGRAIWGVVPAPRIPRIRIAVFAVRTFAAIARTGVNIATISSPAGPAWSSGGARHAWSSGGARHAWGVRDGSSGQAVRSTCPEQVGSGAGRFSPATASLRVAILSPCRRSNQQKSWNNKRPEQ
jgi:hypothetical protein